MRRTSCAAPRYDPGGGGIAPALIFAIALIVASGPVHAPVALYWVLLTVGVVAAIVGFILERNRGGRA